MWYETPREIREPRCEYQYSVDLVAGLCFPDLFLSFFFFLLPFLRIERIRLSWRRFRSSRATVRLIEEFRRVNFSLLEIYHRSRKRKTTYRVFFRELTEYPRISWISPKSLSFRWNERRIRETKADKRTLRYSGVYRNWIANVRILRYKRIPTLGLITLSSPHAPATHSERTVKRPESV